MVRRKRKIMAWSLTGVLVLVAGAGSWLLISHTDRAFNTDLFGVAIKGYDTVGYFTEGRAVRGDSRYEVIWQDTRWRFASAEHRDLFMADPERYIPQYGGFCASYLARGGIAGVDPEAWVIVDGRLYLNWSKESRERWLENAPANIKKADEAWTEKGNQG